MIQHAEEGQLIKVITREMPDSLAVRPPSWVDLREVSLFGDARLRRDIQSVSTCSSFCYFFPSPSYLKSLPSGRFESQEQRTWIVDEAGRIWRELQREDNRVLVRTNVPNEMAEVIHSLTMKLFAQLQMYPTIGRSDAYVAMVATAKAAGLALPLEPGEEIELLRLAKEHLLKRRDGHVRNHFDSLRPRGWRF